MSYFKNTQLQLLALYLVICASLLLRINVESTGYKSPDSEFYLRVAENVLDEKGFVGPKIYPFHEDTQETYFAIWPIGYPAMIVGTSYLTGLDPFWSSKTLNLIFLGLIFILLYRWFADAALLPACYFCSFGRWKYFHIRGLKVLFCSFSFGFFIY